MKAWRLGPTRIADDRPRVLAGVIAATFVAAMTCVSCASGAASPAAATQAAVAQGTSTPAQAVAPASTTAAPDPTPAPSATPTPSPIPRSESCSPSSAGTARSGKGVTLRQYSDGFVDAQIELTAPNGSRVFVDVGSADFVSSPPRAGDVLVTTHDHPDHVNTDFIAAFPGHYVVMGDGLALPWVQITNVDSAHGSEGGPATLRDGRGYMVSNHIYVVEIGGLRIVHFGDLGQTALTRSQLEAIGQVDVAIAQLDNPYSGIGVIDHIGYDLMNQVCPRIVIPTHMLTNDYADAKLAASMWPAVYGAKDSAHVTPANLPSTTTVLLLGARGLRLGRDLGLPKSPW